MVKEVREDVEHPLQPYRMGRRDESVVHIKIRCKVLHQHAKALCSRLCQRYHCNLVAYDGVRYHIEDREGQGISLGFTAVALEGGNIVSPGLIHHGEPILVCTENPECPEDHTLSCQDLKTPVLIQGY